MALVAVSPVEPKVDASLDPVAFTAFYRESMPHVYGYLLRRSGGNTALAEELTQEVFTAVVRDLRRGRRVEASLPVLLGIARHKLIDQFRRQVRSARLVTADDAVDISNLPLDASADDARERAGAALTAVPDSQRAVLVLRYLEGFSVSEIAAALDRSVEAVESLLARGRTSFKRAYLEGSA